MTGRVLLTGAAGLLGTWLRRTAPASAHVVSLTHRTRVDRGDEVVADLCDSSATRRAVERAAPALVIHTAYGKDEQSIVDATRNVTSAASGCGADVLFVSTDAVFNGDGIPRNEDAPPEPIADYGRWKAAAEHIVAAATDRSVVARLSLIASLDPDDHIVREVRSEAGGRSAMTWFDDEFRQPALASDLATGLWNIAALDPAARAGIWHLPGPEVLSRADIARRAATAIGLDVDQLRIGPTPSHLQRPRDIRLTCERATRAIAWAPSPIFT